MLFPWSNPRVRAAADRAGPASVRSTEDAEKWSAGLAHQDVEARVVSLEDLVDLVHGGSGTGWAEAAEAAQRVGMAHREVADLLHSVLTRLDSAWRGDAADAAGATTRAFGGALDTTEARYVHNGLNITEADHHYRQLRAELAHLGPRPEKSLWDHLTPWDTDTEKAITAYNENAARYLEHYHAYAAQLDGQARALRYDEGDPAVDRARPTSGGCATDPACGGSTPAVTRPYPGFPATTGFPAPTAQPPAGAVPPPAPAVPSPAFAAPPAPAAFSPAPGPLPDSPVTAAPPDATSTTGFVPTGPPAFATPAAPVSPPGAGAVPPGFGAVPPGFTGNPRGGLVGGELRTAGESLRGAGGTGPGSGAAPGSGRGSLREGDRDHERKYVLDDGSLFTDEERYGWVDPVTGRTTVDPTIGA